MPVIVVRATVGALLGTGDVLSDIVTICTLFGLGLGPWFTGFVSKVSGSLGTGVLALLLMAPFTIICLYFVYRLLPKAEATRLDRARAAGEIIGASAT